MKKNNKFLDNVLYVVFILMLLVTTHLILVNL